ncbi:MAG: head-tail connector protein [Chloroflexi bacterium]|nr:head-tail connector protein [Chloroflexota bacterium]
MLLLIGHWYESREAAGGARGEIPFGVDALIWSFREAARIRG